MIFKLNKLILIMMIPMMVGCAGRNVKVEPWIQTDDLFKINIGMSSKEVIAVLGEPLFYENILDEDDDLITTKFIYNFRTQMDSHEKSKPQELQKMPTKGRTTNIQFTFINDTLMGWEEDKLTLSMASNSAPKGNSSLQLIGLLLNLIIIIKVF